MKINHVSYAWAQLELKMVGQGAVDLKGVQAIEWNMKRNVKTNYGLGGQPIGRGFGNIEYTASIELDYNAQVQLRSLRGSLMNIGEFDLILSFAGDLKSDDYTEEVVTLKGCFFNEDGLDVKQDDTNITKKFELNPWRIEASGQP